ncbi:MAG: HEAT repeat domain-containing protein [Sandaracinaceae bacterium]|nr:HEAT repeat domain-containing protein [Sandaracinaceae bacterium]
MLPESSCSVRRRSFRRTFQVALTLAAFWFGAPSKADERTDYLVQLLRNSPAFRVRAQAAISLGNGSPSPEAIRALIAALRDENAAVRTAAASALARIGDQSAIEALRASEKDPEEAVRQAASSAILAIQNRERLSRPSQPSSAPAPPSPGPPKYYVGLGRPSVSGPLPSPLSQSLRSLIERRLLAIGGISIAPDGESPAAAQKVLRQRSLTGIYLDVSVVIDNPSSNAVRARVSVVVQDYPGRNVRSMLSGSATATGTSTPDEALLDAAIGSAFNRLPMALASASR